MNGWMDGWMVGGSYSFSLSYVNMSSKACVGTIWFMGQVEENNTKKIQTRSMRLKTQKLSLTWNELSFLFVQNPNEARVLHKVMCHTCISYVKKHDATFALFKSFTTNLKVITRGRKLRCRGKREDRVVKEKDMQEGSLALRRKWIGSEWHWSECLKQVMTYDVLNNSSHDNCSFKLHNNAPHL